MGKTVRRVVNDKFMLESGQGNRAGIHGKKKPHRDERRNTKVSLRSGKYE